METPPPPPPVPPVAAAADSSAAPAVALTLSRQAQVAMGLVLLATLVLLVYRGYGNGFGSRPVERASAAITDLNKADRAELEQVPGIGPTLAREIEDHRKKKGPFKSIDELRQVKGVGPLTLDKVRPYLRVEAVSISSSDSLATEPLVLERKPSAPTPAPAPRASGAKKFQAGDPPIDINSANLDDLVKLPGVGPVTAQHILAARAERPFGSVGELNRVKGIGPKTLEKIRPFVMVRTRD